MKRILIYTLCYLILLIISLLVTRNTIAQAKSTPLIFAPVVTHIESLDEKEIKYALKYKVSLALIKTIIQKEDGCGIQSYIPDPTGPNGREDSWGCSQIHLPDHREVTKEQALDADFALDFLAKNLSLDKCYLWMTCPLI